MFFQILYPRLPRYYYARLSVRPSRPSIRLRSSISGNFVSDGVVSDAGPAVALADPLSPEPEAAAAAGDAGADGAVAVRRKPVAVRRKDLVNLGRTVVDFVTKQSEVELGNHRDETILAARRIVGAAFSSGSCKSTVLRKRLGIGAKMAKGIVKKRIIKQGCRNRSGPKCRITDAMIKNVIAGHTKPSCRFKANKEPILCIMRSWRRLHLTDPNIARLISERHLTRRCRLCALGISKGGKRTDLCSVCNAWDFQVGAD